MVYPIVYPCHMVVEKPAWWWSRFKEPPKYRSYPRWPAAFNHVTSPQLRNHVSPHYCRPPHASSPIHRYLLSFTLVTTRPAPSLSGRVSPSRPAQSRHLYVSPKIHHPTSKYIPSHLSVHASHVERGPSLGLYHIAIGKGFTLYRILFVRLLSPFRL